MSGHPPRHQQQQRRPQQQQQQPPQQQQQQQPHGAHQHRVQQPRAQAHAQQAHVKSQVAAAAPPAPAQIQWGSRSVLVFDKQAMVGQGTYGKVYRAVDKATGELVALKKIKPEDSSKKEKDGFPITAIREIKILKSLNHTNVVRLKEIVTSRPQEEGVLGPDGKPKKASIYMVFEYLEHDLTGLILSGKEFMQNLKDDHIKCLAYQLFTGIRYLHSCNVLHRDLKGSNLLVNKKGELKIADFGLARPVKEGRASYTNPVITLWYRPPELLLGDCKYGKAADVWSAGCILAELLLRDAPFKGRDELDQLDKIFSKTGTPTEETWPSMVESELWKSSPKPKTTYPTNHLPKIFAKHGEACVKLMLSLLNLDPDKRISADEALDHEYMWTMPLACKPHELPLSGLSDSHEYSAKQSLQGQRGSAQAAGKQRPSGGAQYGEQPAAKRQRLGHDAYAPHDYSTSAAHGSGYGDTRGPSPVGHGPPPAQGGHYPSGTRPYHPPAGVPPHRQQPPPARVPPHMPSGGGYAGGGHRGRR